MKGFKVTATILLTMASLSAKATNSTYSCTGEFLSGKSLSILIESGTESGVGDISVSGNGSYKLGWAGDSNQGNQTECQNLNPSENTFVLTEGAGADSYAFEFPNVIFDHPVSAFEMNVIFDQDSDGKACSVQQLTCKNKGE